MPIPQYNVFGSVFKINYTRCTNDKDELQPEPLAFDICMADLIPSCDLYLLPASVHEELDQCRTPPDGHVTLRGPCLSCDLS